MDHYLTWLGSGSNPINYVIGSVVPLWVIITFVFGFFRRDRYGTPAIFENPWPAIPVYGLALIWPIAILIVLAISFLYGIFRLGDFLRQRFFDG